MRGMRVCMDLRVPGKVVVGENKKCVAEANCLPDCLTHASRHALVRQQVRLIEPGIVVLML